MSELSDEIAALNSAADATAQRVQTDVANYKQTIVDLEKKVAEGTATPTDIENLKRARSVIEAIDPTNPAVLPEALRRRRP